MAYSITRLEIPVFSSAPTDTKNVNNIASLQQAIRIYMETNSCHVIGDWCKENYESSDMANEVYDTIVQAVNLSIIKDYNDQDSIDLILRILEAG